MIDFVFGECARRRSTGGAPLAAGTPSHAGARPPRGKCRLTQGAAPMSRNRSILMATLAAFVAGAAIAGDPVKIAKADLEKALPGKTLNYTNINGSSAIVSFFADGRATYKTGTLKASTGTWTVEDNGRYCIKITSGTVSDHCRHVWKTDSGYALGTSKGENLVPVSGFE
ncbi:MAG: hypothetical protein ACXWUL_08900 [Caldimonas sp.]